MGKSASELVTEAKGKVQNVTPEEVAAELEKGDVVLVDLREGPELEKSGRIPGSVHIPRGMLEFRADPSSPYHDEALDPGRRVILHCASGGRSALGASALQDMGYGNVAHLDGGITKWAEEGRPTEKP